MKRFSNLDKWFVVGVLCFLGLVGFIRHAQGGSLSDLAIPEQQAKLAETKYLSRSTESVTTVCTLTFPGFGTSSKVEVAAGSITYSVSWGQIGMSTRTLQATSNEWVKDEEIFATPTDSPTIVSIISIQSGATAQIRISGKTYQVMGK